MRVECDWGSSEEGEHTTAIALLQRRAGSVSDGFNKFEGYEMLGGEGGALW